MRSEGFAGLKKAADERIRELAPLLTRSDNRKTWGLLASHLPGWTGRQCYERWAAMGKHRPQLKSGRAKEELTKSSQASRWIDQQLRTMQ